jgi:hypothetical protein
MKKWTIIVSLMLAGFSASAVEMSKSDAKEFYKTATEDFASFGGWDSRCTTAWNADKIVCEKGDITHYCTVEGMHFSTAEDNVLTKESYGLRKIVQKLAASKGKVIVKGVECYADHSGFANCGSGEDDLTCTYESIETK